MLIPLPGRTPRTVMAGTTEQGRLFLRVLLWIALVLVTLVVLPFIGALFAGAVFATVLFPLQQRLSKRLHNRPRTAAALLTTTLVLVVFLPVVGVGFVAGNRIATMVDDAVETVDREGFEGLVEDLPEGVRAVALRVAAAFSTPNETADAAADAMPTKVVPDDTDTTEELGPVDSKAVVDTSAKVATAVVAWLAEFAIDIGILVIAVYFLLAQGAELVRWICETVPLSERQTMQFVDESRDATVAVFVSTVVSSFAQTLIAAIGYLIAGTPMFLIVVMLTMIGAFVPVIGGATIVVCVGLITLLLGSTGAGVFLIAWGVIPVGISDNLLKPMLTSGRMKAKLPGSVLFFAMLGGLALMGPMGIIGGPLVLSFLLVVLRVLRQEPAPASQAAGA